MRGSGVVSWLSRRRGLARSSLSGVCVLRRRWPLPPPLLGSAIAATCHCGHHVLAKLVVVGHVVFWGACCCWRLGSRPPC